MKNMFASLLALLIVCGAASAQEQQKTRTLKTSVTLGATLTDGNSDTMQANASLLTEGAKDGAGSVRAGAEANYGESTVDNEDEKTIDNARAFANAKMTMTPRTFMSLDADVKYDNIALIDYRGVLSPGLGAYLVKNETTALSVEAGPSYLWEKVAEVTDDYLALRLAERLEQTISATSKAWQSAEYLPKADDFDDYLLNAEIGSEAAMNSHMKLRVVLQSKYDSTPAAGLEKNDLTLIAGVSLSL